MRMLNHLSRILLGATCLALVSLSQASDAPQVKIQTNHGDIIVELDVEKAPKTVANFLSYVEDGFYTNTIFHRVIDGFMIQGGGFTPRFERKPTQPPIINEADNGLKNDRGTIAMARTAEPHSATAQFFINVVDNHFLDHSAKTPRGWGYTVFGKVVKGMNVVDTIRAIPTGPGGPFPQNVPKSAAIILGMTYINKPRAAPTEAPAKTDAAKGSKP